MNLARRPPVQHPLAPVFERAVDSLCIALSPDTTRHYRGTVRKFLGYLAADHPEVNRLDQLRRQPHILGWMSRLRSQTPSLSTASCINQLIALRCLCNELAWSNERFELARLIRREDIPHTPQRLPRPLSVPFGKLKTERLVPIDASTCDLIQRLRFFRSLDPLPADGRLLARPASKEALVRQLRDYLHQVCHALNLSIQIVPHQLRHTYATEMLRAGVSFPVLMKLLGHTDPEMTMRYVDVALTDLQREFHQARAHPKYLVPQPKTSSIPLRAGLDGVIDSLLAAQHVLEMFRRPLPKGASRSCLDRLSNRLTKILTEARKLRTT